MPERDPLRSQGDFVIDVEAGDGGPWAFKSYRTQTPFTVTSSGDFVVRTGEAERLRVTSGGVVSGVGAMSLGWFNVKDPKYGAKGDGTTDDTAAIQAAINAAGAGNGTIQGGIVYLPSGKYRITGTLLVTNPGVQIRGAGMGSPFNTTGGLMGPTVLVGASTFTGSELIRIMQSGTPAMALTGVVLRDFSIYAASLPASTDGILAQIVDGLIDQVRVDGAPGHNLRLQSATASGDGCFNLIRGSQFRTSGGHGIFFESGVDSWVVNTLIYQAGQDGINCATAPGVHAIGNLISANRYGVNGTTYDTKVMHNRIEGTNGGVYLSNTLNNYGGFQIIGNKIWSSSITADNTTDSVNVTSGVANTRGGIISGNDFFTNSGGNNGQSGGNYNRARYHVNIASANITDVVVGPNSYLGYVQALSSYGTAAIHDLGTRTQFATWGAFGSLPTADPHQPGQLWSNAGTITVSAG